MKEVCIIFSTPKKFHLSSFLLKTKVFGMGTPFSHTCLKIYSTAYDRTLIYEANADGIRAEEFKSWNKKNKVIYEREFKLTMDRKISLIRFCIDNLGRKYNFKTIRYLFFWDKFKVLFGGGKDGPKSFICSEFAYYMLKDEIDRLYSKIGRPLPGSLEDMHPLELYKALTAVPKSVGDDTEVA